jgi:hypothetical protein
MTSRRFFLISVLAFLFLLSYYSGHVDLHTLKEPIKSSPLGPAKPSQSIEERLDLLDYDLMQAYYHIIENNLEYFSSLEPDNLSSSEIDYIHKSYRPLVIRHMDETANVEKAVIFFITDIQKYIKEKLYTNKEMHLTNEKL